MQFHAVLALFTVNVRYAFVDDFVLISWLLQFHAGKTKMGHHGVTLAVACNVHFDGHNV